MAKTTDTTAAPCIRRRPADRISCAPSRRGLFLLDAGLLPLAAVAPALALRPEHPDTALIAMCTRLPGALEAYNRCDCSDTAEDARAWAAYEQVRDTVLETRPHTIEGLRAQAIAAKYQARVGVGDDPDREQPENTPAADMAWNLLNDFLRLTAGGAA